MIVVTGGSGHLGQWVVAALMRVGHDVLLISRKPIDRPTIGGVEWSKRPAVLACDLGDLDAVERLRPKLADATGAVHLAAYVPADTTANHFKDADETLRSNVQGTVHLLSALQHAKSLKSVVHASTFEVYGEPLRTRISEDHPTNPLSFYGASKLASEKFFALFSRQSSIAAASLRFPAIYGPGDTINRAIGNFVRAAVDTSPIDIFGDGADLRDAVYAGDAADGVLAALCKSASGAFNMGNGVGYSIRQMAEVANTLAGGRLEIVQRERVKPRRDYVLDVEHARSELTWFAKTSIMDGMRAQFEWLRATRRRS
jgi:UDP-glucose 4-epimerase